MPKKEPEQVSHVREQLPIWRQMKVAQFEAAELQNLADDIQMYDDATDQATKDAIVEMLSDDAEAIDVVDERLKTGDMI